MEKEKTENDNTSIETLLERAESFGKTSLELYRLKAIEKIATITSDIVSSLILVLCAALFFMMLNVGIALWLGDLLGAAYLGFLIISGVYLLFFVICYVLRERIIKLPIIKSIIEKTL